MYDNGDCTKDEIIAEEAFERKLKKASTLQARVGRHYAHCSKLKKIMKHIEGNLKANRPYPLKRIGDYIENYKDYPEVRPYAPQVIAKITQTKVSPQRVRIEMCARLKRVMERFQGR